MLIEIGKTKDLANALVERPRDIIETGTWFGIFDVEHWRDGKMIANPVSHNALTTEGKRYMVDICMKGNVGNTYAFHTAWYVILAGNGAGGGAPTTAPTGGSIPAMNYDVQVFTEFRDYNEATRPQWNGTLDVSAASITSNAAKATFNIVANSANSGTIFGAGLVTLNTKNDHTVGDYLLNYSNFTSSIIVSAGDVVKVGVTIGLS